MPISVNCGKARYVSDHLELYPNIFRDALRDFLQRGNSFTTEDLSSPQKILRKLKILTFCYVMLNPNHYELKASLKSKRAIIRINYALPKGKKIPFFELLAIEKLLGSII